MAVRDDLAASDWERSTNRVQRPLRTRIGDDVADLFQPMFSTTTPGDATAVLVALMDAVSPYYRFRWISLCGIPRIRLEGSGRDWRLLAGRVRELEEWFDPKVSFGTGTSVKEEFPSYLSHVPFRWETPAGVHRMAFLGGVLGITRDGEWIRPRLGHAVVELLSADD
ncbi:DUF4419 domain-containing protein [Streptomyces sp. NBC_00893]|uniref:DUF4419 domain-containing protein n=1 Tax=Streptomyces sp. NBC_00893 TaxID=2975862 RepID=UPI00224DE7C6|nr:DUF4419 domain-containing protein [Streptomyces sp. NBC_00893]MCX4850206.1 DUF4419 domain-containing protein [Streptomyces sp. NBC_00893]